MGVETYLWKRNERGPAIVIFEMDGAGKNELEENLIDVRNFECQSKFITQ